MVAVALLVSLGMTLPTRPAFRPAALPVKLAGGLFLFASSVPAAQKEAAQELQRLAQSALRADPRVTMELGMGIEAGGIFGSATSDEGNLVINFQINGGNSWAECTAFGKKQGDGSLALVDLTIANMDAAMSGQASLSVAVSQQQSLASPVVEASMVEAMVAAEAAERIKRVQATPPASRSRPSQMTAAAVSPAPNLHALLLSRRTINEFRSELPAKWEAAVLRAIEAATFAPNHKRSEPWRFHLLGPEAIRRVCELNAELVAAKKGEAAGAKKLSRWLKMPGWLVVTCVRRGSDDGEADGTAATLDDPMGLAREDVDASRLARQASCQRHPEKS